MMTRTDAEQLLRDLKVLPDDKLAEVRDFVLYLRERYARPRPADESDAWTEEDICELAAAALHHADQAL